MATSRERRKKKAAYENAKYRRPTLEAQEYFLKRSEDLVPLWIRILSYYVPPKWYVKQVEKVMLQLLFSGHKPLSLFVRFVFLVPMYKIKAKLRYFGVRVKFNPKRGSLEMKIIKWWRVIEAKEWKI